MERKRAKDTESRELEQEKSHNKNAALCKSYTELRFLAEIDVTTSDWQQKQN